MERPQQGPRRLRQLLIQTYPRVQIEKSDVRPIRSGTAATTKRHEQEPLAIDYRGTIQQFSHRENRVRTFPPFPHPIAALKRLLAPKERRHAYRIQRDVIYQEDLTYEAPKGWAFTSVPTSCFWQGEFGLYGMSFALDGRTLKASQFLIIPARSLEPWQVPTLLRWVEACRHREQGLTIGMAPLPEGATYNPVPELRMAEVVDRRPFYLRWPGTPPLVEVETTP
jgi:hypothetical protein